MPSSLTIRNLNIRKMPGFESGIKAYKDFSGAINIIAGPNASGKSSTSRIIQKIIWLNQTSGIEANASVEVAGTPWEIKIYSNIHNVQKDGIDSTLEPLPSVESSHRYQLALHELVRENDAEIAGEIFRQASGGYNLELAADKLSYSDTPRRGNITQFSDFKKAREERLKEEKKQKQLKEEEEGLAENIRLAAEYKKASILKVLYEKVLAFKQASLNFSQVKEALDQFPAALQNARGDEAETFEQILTAIAEKQTEAAIAENKLNDCTRELERLKIPVEGLKPELLNELEERIARLIEYETTIISIDSQIKQAVEKEKIAISAIDKRIDPENWEGLNLESISELDKFLNIAIKIQSEKQYHEIYKKELEKEITPNEHTADQLKAGIHILNAWIQERTERKGISKYMILSISAVAILTAVLSYSFGWLGLMGIIVIIALSIIFLITEKDTKTKGNRSIRKKDYEATGLSQPALWSENEVIKTLEELISDLQEAEWQKKIETRNDINEHALKELQPRLEKLITEKERLLQKLKGLPPLPEHDPKDYTELYWFIKHVNQWQDAHTLSLSFSVDLNSHKEAYKSEIETVNQLLQMSNAVSAKDYSEAHALFKRLKKEEETRKENVNKMETLKSELKRLSVDIGKLNEEKDNIFSSLNLENDNSSALKELMEQMDDFKSTKEKYRSAEDKLQDKKSELLQDPYYETIAEQIEFISINQAEERKLQFATDAIKYQPIRDNIIKIETRINEAKVGNSLEEALSKEEKSLEELEQVFEKNLTSITGRLLVDQLREDSTGYNASAVYIRANELFSNITAGRYELKIDKSKNGAFSAYDSIQSQGLSLDKLSTGTRIQLLLSVRIAYIEQLEKDKLKLPLLADELLANCDDTRAKAIIEALIRISKEGRQVFYFTAQADEVSKWISYLKTEEKIDHKIFELTGEGNEEIEYIAAPLINQPVFLFQEIPLPGTNSHAEYAGKIGVIPFSPLTQIGDQIHLWYLIEDTNVLYNCLRKNVKFWKQLQQFLKEGGKIDGLSDDLLKDLKEKAVFLEKFITDYRIGRPKPIDINVLEDSGVVTPGFRESINNKLIELGRDPVKLIRALRNNEIARFREKSISELEEYLLDEGYISRDEPLEMDEIIRRLHAAFPERMGDGRAVENLINRVIESQSMSFS